MTPRCVLAILLALGAGRAACGAAAAPPPAPKPTLQEQLAREKARLARLQAELQGLADEGGGTSGEGRGTRDEGRGSRDEGGGTERTDAKASSLDPRPSTPDPLPSPLLRRPTLAAADVLYRLARHKEARAVYEACAAAPKVTESDFTWALLQAGNCCRRLGDFDEAIKHFQTLIAAYPDSPWSKGHVAWALQTAQWEKRCQRLEPSTGE